MLSTLSKDTHLLSGAAGFGPGQTVGKKDHWDASESPPGSPIGVYRGLFSLHSLLFGPEGLPLYSLEGAPA